MTEHDPGRRTFLVRAIVGTGAIAGAELVPAQNTESPKEANAPAQSHSGQDRQGAFFNRDDAATVAAFTERLMPGDGGLDLRGILRRVPPDIPLSLEIPMRTLACTMPALERTRLMLAKTRRLLETL